MDQRSHDAPGVLPHPGHHPYAPPPPALSRAPRKLLLDCPSLGNPNTSACMADARLTWLTWSTSRPPHPRQQPHLHLSLRRRLDHNACSILSSHQVGTMGVLKPAMLGAHPPGGDHAVGRGKCAQKACKMGSGEVRKGKGEQVCVCTYCVSVCVPSVWQCVYLLRVSVYLVHGSVCLVHGSVCPYCVSVCVPTVSMCMPPV